MAEDPTNGIDGLIIQENSDLRDRMTDLEKKVNDQTDEIVCLKSAVADCLRRLNTLESAKALQPTGGSSKLSPSGGSHPNIARRSAGGSGGSASSPRSRNVAGDTAGQTVRKSTASTLNSSPRGTGSASGSTATTPGSTGGGRSGYKSSSMSDHGKYVGDGEVKSATHSSAWRPGGAAIAHPPTPPPSGKKVDGMSASVILDNNVKDPVFIQDEGILRTYLRGRAINMYAPTSLTDYDVKKVGEAPAEKLKLEWVYGYRGRDCRNNVHFLPTGEVVYFVASVVILYNIDEQMQRHYLGHNDDVKSIAVHPDRITIATGQVAGHDRAQGKPHIRIWNSVNLNTLHVLGLGEFERAVCCIAFSRADGGELLCAVDDANEHVISIWEWQKAHKITETKSSTDPVLAAEFHPLEAGSIVTCGKGHLSFWTLDGIQLSKKQGIFEKYEKPKFVLCLTFAENGDLITGDSTGNVFVWPKGSNKINQAMLAAHEGGIFSVCMTKEGHLISGGGKDRKIIHWDSAYNRTGQEAEIPVQYGPVRTLSQGAGGMILVGTTKNCILQGSIGLEFRSVVSGHTEEVWGLACHPSLPQFLTAGYDRSIFLWDTLTRQAVWTKELSDPAHCATFYPRGGELVTIGTQSGRWIVLDTTAREIVAVHTDGNEQIECLEYSPDGNYLALGSRDNCIYVYSTVEGGRKYSRIGKCCGHSSFVLHLDWSQDSQHLRSTSGDYELLYWTAHNCRQVSASSSMRDVEWVSQSCTLGWEVAGIWPEGADGTDINGAARAANKPLLATADDFGKVNLFRFPVIHPKSVCHTYGGHSSHVSNVRFISDDARLISTGGRDTAVMQWEVV